MPRPATEPADMSRMMRAYAPAMTISCRPRSASVPSIPSSQRRHPGQGTGLGLSMIMVLLVSPAVRCGRSRACRQLLIDQAERSLLQLNVSIRYAVIEPVAIAVGIQGSQLAAILGSRPDDRATVDPLFLFTDTFVLRFAVRGRS